MRTEIVKVPLTLYGVSLRPLTPKHRLYVINLFMNGFDKKKAAEDAGYKQAAAKGSQLFNREDIKRVIEKIQRKIGKETDLKLENVLENLHKALFRSKNAFVDSQGNDITRIADLPDDVNAYLDGWEIENGVEEDSEGNMVTYPKKIKFKLSPTATVRDQALKVLGGYAPEKSERKHTLDWDQHLEPPSDADRVELEIEAEYERIDDAEG